MLRREAIQEAHVAAAIYAGSFDPISNGHLAIIRAGLVTFDRIIVAVLTNPAKSPLVSVEERSAMIEDEFGEDRRVEADCFEDGLLVEYARSKGVNVVLRGLRAAVTSIAKSRWPQ